MNQDEMKELLARLPGIETRAKGWRKTANIESPMLGSRTLILEDVPALCAAVRELAAEVERLREGLEHYADPESWDDADDTYGGSPVIYCGGKGGPEHARQVLGKEAE